MGASAVGARFIAFTVLVHAATYARSQEDGRAQAGSPLAQGAGLDAETRELAPTEPTVSFRTPFGTTLGRMVEALERQRAVVNASNIQRGEFRNEAVLRELCNGYLLDVDARTADDNYAAAYPLKHNGTLPNKCTYGCTLGRSMVNAITRLYQADQTGTADSWRGKCFNPKERTLVNRITVKPMRVGPGFESLLFPGDVYQGRSMFEDGGSAVVVDYSDYVHDFKSFRDELRLIAPGVWLGRMYTLMPGEVIANSMKVPQKGRRSERLPNGVFLTSFVLFDVAAADDSSAENAAAPIRIGDGSPKTTAMMQGVVNVAMAAAKIGSAAVMMG